MVLVEKGVWERSEVLRFSTKWRDDPAGHAISDEGNISIPVISLDSALHDLGLERVDLVKIDVEGAELRVIEGALETIRYYRPRISIGTEHTDDHLMNTLAVVARMEALGYDYVCTQSAPDYSPSLKRVMLTPGSVHFTPCKA